MVGLVHLFCLQLALLFLLVNQSTTRKSTIIMIRLLNPFISRGSLDKVKWSAIPRKKMSNTHDPEDEVTKKTASKKGRFLKPRREGEKEDMLAGLRGELAKYGATPKELKTVRVLPKYRFDIKRKDEKLPTMQGRWIKEETDILKDMRKDHVHPRVIADRLGRKTSSVVNKTSSLADYFKECNEASRFEGPHSLPPELEESLLRLRLQIIWEGLMKSMMTQMWDEVLKTHNPSH